MGNESNVALAVSSGCHIASTEADTVRKCGSVERLLNTLGDTEEKRKASIAEPLPDRSQQRRLCHLLAWERCSKPRLLGNGVRWGETRDLEELFTHNFIIGLLSRGSMPTLLSTPLTQPFESIMLAPV